MLLWLQKHFNGIRPVVLDGFLWVVIGINTTVLPLLSGKEAYEYVNPYVVWWLKFFLVAIGGGATSLRMFRDRGYARYRDKEDGK